MGRKLRVFVSPLGTGIGYFIQGMTEFVAPTASNVMLGGRFFAGFFSGMGPVFIAHLTELSSHDPALLKPRVVMMELSSQTLGLGVPGHAPSAAALFGASERTSASSFCLPSSSEDDHGQGPAKCRRGARSASSRRESERRSERNEGVRVRPRCSLSARTRAAISWSTASPPEARRAAGGARWPPCVAPARPAGPSASRRGRARQPVGLGSPRVSSQKVQRVREGQRRSEKVEEGWRRFDK